MADVIRKVDYFKLVAANRPGEAARIMQVLRDAKVNLLAFTGFPQGRKAQMDFVPENSAAFKKAMKRAGFRISTKKTVFLIRGKDRVGAIHAVVQKLGGAKINITALDAVTDGKGRYCAILWVKPKDLRKAAKAIGAT